MSWIVTIYVTSTTRFSRFCAKLEVFEKITWVMQKKEFFVHSDNVTSRTLSCPLWCSDAMRPSSSIFNCKFGTLLASCKLKLPPVFLVLYSRFWEAILLIIFSAKILNLSKLAPKLLAPVVRVDILVKNSHLVLCVCVMVIMKSVCFTYYTKDGAQKFPAWQLLNDLARFSPLFSGKKTPKNFSVLYINN